MALISVLTAAHNEVGNIDEFLNKLVRCFQNNSLNGELLIINDGSTDGTDQKILKFMERYNFIRLINKNKREGLTEVLNTGLKNVKGEIIVILPADLESDPEEDIPKLLDKLSEGFDVVAGCRRNRSDGKVLTSKLYNFACRRLFKVSIHDMNWIKAMKKETVNDLKLRSDWHRFLIPILAVRGYRVSEVITNWYPREYGRSKFGLKRLFVCIYDIITLVFILKIKKKTL